MSHNSSLRGMHQICRKKNSPVRRDSQKWPNWPRKKVCRSERGSPGCSLSPCSSEVVLDLPPASCPWSQGQRRWWRPRWPHTCRQRARRSQHWSADPERNHRHHNRTSHQGPMTSPPETNGITTWHHYQRPTPSHQGPTTLPPKINDITTWHHHKGNQNHVMLLAWRPRHTDWKSVWWLKTCYKDA